MRRVAITAGLTVTGLAGLAVIAWLVVSRLLGLTLVVFMTGSMAPTMPTGSAAVVSVVPASELAVGEVVTVQRPGEALPVTHRIVSIENVSDSSESRSLVLRGDANQTDDQYPYVVDEAQRVLVAVPYLGTAMSIARTPVVLLTVTVIVAVGITWAFWPRRDPQHRLEEARA